MEEFAESCSDDNQKFDAIVASEIIEHVDNPQLFISSMSTLLKDGGSLFITTLNRQDRSILFFFMLINMKYAMRGTYITLYPFVHILIFLLTPVLSPRTTRSWVVAIVGAEYIVGLLPKGKFKCVQIFK